MLKFILSSFYIFFLFFISHSNIMHREICVKGFSPTTAPRTLKFGTNIGFNLYRARQNQHPPTIIPFICPFFYFSNTFLSKISQELLHLGF